MKIDPQYQDQITTQQYGGKTMIDGVQIIEPKFNSDDGGNFSEIVRFNEQSEIENCPGFQARQASMSVMIPGVIKAFHLHYKQEDLWYVSPYDRLVAVLVDLRQDSPTLGQQQKVVLGGGRNLLLRIPAGVAHGAANLTAEPITLWYFTSAQFNLQDPDEQRLPWDHFGSQIWKMSKG